MLVLIPLKGFCQNTDINLSQKQATEIYKGLIQGINLKETVSILQKDNNDLEKAVILGKSIESDLRTEIDRLNEIISGKNKFIENQAKTNEIDQAKLKEKNNKRFGVGIVGGFGLSTGTTSYQSFIGVGISYDLFRF